LKAFIDPSIHKFKKDYQPRTNSEKGMNRDFVEPSHTNLNKWMLRFRRLPNINGVHDVRQTGIHTHARH